MIEDDGVIGSDQDQQTHILYVHLFVSVLIYCDGMTVKKTKTNKKRRVYVYVCVYVCV